MRSQSLVGALLALVTWVAVPQSASAQSSDVAHTSGTDLLPISYNLASFERDAAAIPPTPQAPAAVDSEASRFRAMQAEAMKWEVGYLALSAIDAAQTIECVGRGACIEANPLFGKHPSAGKVLLLKGGIGLGHFLLFNAINKRNPRAALRGAQLSLGIQGAIVMLNTRTMF